MNSLQLPRGVVLDMDGVLTDSEPFICRAACLMFAEHGLSVEPDDFLPFVGTGENRYLGGVAEKYNFPIDIEQAKKRTYDIYLEIIKGNLKPLPGVQTFLRRCRSMGKKLAIASSADRRKVRGNLIEIGLPEEWFDAVVVGEDVSRKKPDPMIFQTAIERLGLNPSECLVVEDAVSGVEAAKRAGARCLALTTSFPAEKLRAADWIAADLANVWPHILSWPDGL
ncbi:MAG TPA: HAD-IA family hydrolase [Anaerohalosphaeraceae bacterium]|nr:HAD-IA family hydrolase [Phycisphaerae bacterium]HOK95881.1 HAD-IA family hydrolase [Anaerohalosphaeraceae bacterium]HOL32063.1 HAD-IA family hydrolase [Anaerohalosphaeraceae bacterium]HOM75255.1 HAD-IA family hydrolase [Anaerohalosphaeraceae bacterium]HPC64512.1 HAD-IA family hydrolase [Anaerohalosphaeraceae bacterium]